MKAASLLVISAVILAVGPGTCRALENSSAVSPVGSGTAPVSSAGSGLIPSINPIDTSGNLVITGHVGGGRHFRGVVPYQGATDFMASPGSLQSTSGYFDSFLRRSAGAGDFGQYSGRTRPYYSPMETVTTTVPGGKTVFRGPTVGLGGITGERVSGLDLPREQLSYYRDRAVSQLSGRPMSMSRSELEQLMPSTIAQYPQGGEQPDKQAVERITAPRRDRPGYFSRDFVEEYRPRLGQVGDFNKPYSGPFAGIGQPEPNGFSRAGYRRQPVRAVATGAEQRRAGMLGQFSNTLEGVWGMDVYDRMLWQMGKLPEDVAKLYGIGQFEGVAEMPETTSQGDVNSGLAGIDVERGETEKATTKGDLAADMDAIKVSALPSEYKSFAAYSVDKFNQHVRAAESYMKQGRYYRAADAYTLASVYKPGDPLAYAGKSYALFAAGEYMSSALFLSRALEMFPEYAKVKVDIVAMVGDRDRVETRLADIRDWESRSNAGELDFLLGYMYFELGRLEFAKRSADSALKKMPDSAAVKALKQAIAERIANL